MRNGQFSQSGGTDTDENEEEEEDDDDAESEESAEDECSVRVTGSRLHHSCREHRRDRRHVTSEPSMPASMRMKKGVVAIFCSTDRHVVVNSGDCASGDEEIFVLRERDKELSGRVNEGVSHSQCFISCNMGPTCGVNACA